ARRDFAGGDEDQRAKSGLRGVRGERRAGVAGRRAGDGRRAEAHGLRHGDGHAAVLERAGRVLAFVLEEDAVALVEPRGALGMRDDLVVVDVEDAFAEAPDAALIDGLARGAALVEELRVRGERVALDGQEVAAVAGVADFVRGVSPAAGDAAEF